MKTFKDLGLTSKVQEAISALGYESPSKIQESIIPLIIDGKDVIGKAQTGTGKTMAFAASVLSKINIESRETQVIVLTPTRELALQVSEEFIGLNLESKFKIAAVYGGSSIENQIKDLKRGAQVVVGTPGRIMDLLKRKILKIDNLKFFILDEADEMLNMGFIEDIEFIFNKTNFEKQVLLFSATMPKPIEKLASKYMRKDYKLVEIKETSKTSVNVKQYYYLVNNKTRSEAMFRVLDAKSPKLGIIFCQTKKDCDELVTKMQKRNYSVEVMHGDIAQSMRIQTLKRFKEGSFNYLIATDVAARGIHVDDIDVVINYNLPQDVESYIHRIGRTGRAGNQGLSISFVTPGEVKFLSDVERIAKCQITKCELPNMENVFENKYQKIKTEVNTLIENKQNEECLPYVRDMNKSDLVNFSSALLKLLFEKEIGSDFEKDLTVKMRQKKQTDKNSTRVFLTIGSIDKLKMGSLLDFLKKETKLPKESFKNIEILNKFTFMDVDSKHVDKFIKVLYNKKYNNRTVRVEKAKR